MPHDKPLKILLVDDEPLALQQIAGYIRQIPFLKLEAQCSNAFEALRVLESQHIDLTDLSDGASRYSRLYGGDPILKNIGSSS